MADHPGKDRFPGEFLQGLFELVNMGDDRRAEHGKGVVSRGRHRRIAEDEVDGAEALAKPMRVELLRRADHHRTDCLESGPQGSVLKHQELHVDGGVARQPAHVLEQHDLGAGPGRVMRHEEHPQAQGRIGHGSAGRLHFLQHPAGGV